MESSGAFPTFTVRHRAAVVSSLLMEALRARLTPDRFGPPVVLLAALAGLYLTTLQTIPNGADHYFMIDVGETQIVLNTWGTLHATGYPLYVVQGNLLVRALRAPGIDAATAPALVSLFWGLAALALVYTLACHLMQRRAPALIMTALFGLTRTVWVHHAIAEIYTFGLAILVALFLIALWRGAVRQRIYWLALLGGIGVAHHRAMILAAPALLYAVWPELRGGRHSLPRVIGGGLLLGLSGFLPYVYLPLRANTDAAWVYGAPGTPAGFIDQFMGREAGHLVGLPASLAVLRDNFDLVNRALISDLTWPGIMAGSAGLLIALRRPRLRRASATMLLSGALAYGFHVVFFRDVLSALILAITLSVAFGWLFLLDAAVRAARAIRLYDAAPLAAIVLAIVLIARNRPFIAGLTADPTGLETIALAEGVPPGAALMLAWGPRHFAVGFARDVQGRFPGLTLLDHKADFAAIAAERQLVTPAYTFYNQPVSWWEARLNAPVVLRAAGPHLVEIDTQPELVADARAGAGISVREQSLSCAPDALLLRVAWRAAERPLHDLSVFVHVLDAEGNLLAQGDQSAPVYGWRPLTGWRAGEVVRDVYPLPRAPGAALVRYGLYRVRDDGGFENEYEFSTPVVCDD